MRNRKSSFDIKRLPLALAVIGCLYGAAALAQENDEDTSEAPREEAAQLERVTVTGSLLRRMEYESTSPVQVITADTSVSVGQIDTAEFLQKSSVAAGSTQINHQFAGFVVEGGTGVQTVSLRGLGAERTAVLLNGHRPGPAGTRGQVLAFDLNVIPQSIIQRIEIVKDGSSSIYGSDAVAGAVNIITRKNFDGPEFSFGGRAPFKRGGESYTASVANGWNFDNGNAILAAEVFQHRPLRYADRDFLNCSADLIYDSAGNRIDRQDRSVMAGTQYEGCNNLLVNAVDDAITGERYIPSPDGVTIGMIPGYRPNVNTNYLNSPMAGHEQVLSPNNWGEAQVIDRQKRMNVYGELNFSFDNVDWRTELLYNNRSTNTHRFRQFFPLIGGVTSPLASYQYTDGSDFAAPVPGGIARPIMPFYSDQEVEIDYFFVNTGFQGLFNSTDTWSWSADFSYSRSDGDYNALSIIKSLTGDADPSLRPWTGGNSPTFDYFQPCALNGDCTDELVSHIGRWHKGNTVYDQFVVNGIVTGDAFDLPAGPVGVALGVEYREFSIDDQPSDMERNGELWGQSSAVQTKGTDNVKEIFGEVEVPLLRGVPAFESLSMNLSARAFDYKTVDDTDFVWKAGLNWQLNSQLRLRATRGTSYRAPGLYEQYLGNLSGFSAQTAIDPCIRWNESTNDFLRANCAAAGIPDDYNATGGSASSAEVFTRGAGGLLDPETSKAFTAGVIWTPEFAPISIALDYFDYEVNGQITRLTAGAIVQGCYSNPVYPNSFCDLFVRNSPDHPTAPNKIEEVYATYVNINQQKVRGYDLLMRYSDDFAFGSLEVEGTFTKTLEQVELLFDDPASGGLSRYDNTGYIGYPSLVGNLRTALRRNDFTYTWSMDYVDATSNTDLTEDVTYQGIAAIRDIVAESRLYHTFSIRYQQPKWSLLMGVSNVFDAKPPYVSTGAATRYGNIPAFATQYDMYGRSLFFRYNQTF